MVVVCCVARCVGMSVVYLICLLVNRLIDLRVLV